MNIVEALRAFILQDAAIAALLVGRVHAGRLPQKTAYPAVRMERSATLPTHSQAGTSDFYDALITLDVVSSTYSDAAAAADLIRARLDGYRGSMPTSGGVTCEGCFVEDVDDQYDDDLQAYVVSLYVNVQHKET